MRRFRRVIAAVGLVLLVPGVVWAQGWLWDVPAEHRQAADIMYALEKGWFSGY